jgi:WD40 repeat protein
MLKNYLRFVLFFLISSGGAAELREWQAEIGPPEKLVCADSSTGLPITFLSTLHSRERLFSCHQPAFLPDGSMIIFSSDRSGLAAYYGYLVPNGELVKFLPDAVSNAYGAVVSRKQNTLYLLRKRSLFAWHFGGNGSDSKREVKIQEKKLGEIPEGFSLLESMTENGDGTCLSLLLQDQVDELAMAVFFIETGELRFLARGIGKVSRLQFNPYDSASLLFCGGDNPSGLWLVDVNGQPARLLVNIPANDRIADAQWCKDGRISLLTLPALGEPDHQLVDVASGKTNTRHLPESGVAQGSALASACVSPDNRWIAFLGQNGSVILSDLQGVIQVPVVSGHAHVDGDFVPQISWDPQGKWILFTSGLFHNMDVCLMALASMVKER